MTMIETSTFEQGPQEARSPSEELEARIGGYIDLFAKLTATDGSLITITENPILTLVNGEYLPKTETNESIETKSFADVAYYTNEDDAEVLEVALGSLSSTRSHLDLIQLMRTPDGKLSATYDSSSRSGGETQRSVLRHSTGKPSAHHHEEKMLLGSLDLTLRSLLG